MAVLAGAPSAPASGQSLGAAIALAGAAFAALSMIQTSRLTHSEHPVVIAFYFSGLTTGVGALAVAAGLLCPADWPAAAFFARQHWVAPAGPEWAVLVVVGLAGGLAQIAVTQSYRYADASVLAVSTIPVMVWAMIASAMIFGELVSIQVAVGAEIVSGAGLFVIFWTQCLAEERFRSIFQTISAIIQSKRILQGLPMGVEGRDKAEGFGGGGGRPSGHLGKTVQRLRKAYNLSLSELSEQSGVAKSIISQIERNETNPTLSTIWRLAQALDVSIERVLQVSRGRTLHREDLAGRNADSRLRRRQVPLAIIGWIKTVEWLQCYDFYADPGGCWNPKPHQRGAVECLSVLEASSRSRSPASRNGANPAKPCAIAATARMSSATIGATPAHATMVCILKAAAME